MNVALVKVYYVRSAVDFAASHYEHSEYQRVMQELPSSQTPLLQALRPAEFCARENLCQVLSAIAHVAGDGAEDDLAACGEFVNARIANAFTRLAMGLLTPATFVQKAPSFWRRDQRASGTCEVEQLDAAARRGRLRLVGVEHYQHIAPFWLGFLRGALRSLCDAAELTQSGWSPACPGPDTVAYEVSWS